MQPALRRAGGMVDIYKYVGAPEHAINQETARVNLHEFGALRHVARRDLMPRAATH